MVTMEDISLELGCSINTVSKALNNKPDVSPKTRKLVIETARRMGYVPNALAKSLVTRSSGTIGIVVPSVTSSIYAEMVETVMKSAARRGYATFLAISSENEDEELAAVESLFQKRVDGMVIVPVSEKPSYHETMKAFGQPVVYACNNVEYDDAHFIGQNLNKCSYKVTQHLIDQGCKNLALLCSGFGETKSSIEKGFVRCLEDNDIHDCNANVFRPSSHLKPHDSGYEISKLLDTRIDEFDGLVLEHEDLYFGVKRLLDDHGLSCPGDLLLAACTGLGAKGSPFLTLTSIEVNPAEIGGQAFACLRELMKNGDVKQDKRAVEDELIIRKSSRR